MQIDTNIIVALMRRNGMTAEANAVERGEAVVGQICDMVQNGAKPVLAKPDCGCEKPSLTEAGRGDTIPGMDVGFMFPGCYAECDKIDPCLEPYLRDQYLQIDAWSWVELMQHESELVHVDKIVGVAPFQTDVSLASGESVLFAQEDGQQLAYIPGLLKVKATFSDGEDHLADLSLQLYAGPRSLTGLTSVSALTQVGRAFKFEDFVCGDSCYLARWPKLFRCRNRVIPGPRSVYVTVTAGTLPDGVTVESLSIVIIKAHTEAFFNCCTAAKISTAWGV
jgi:hypothetical protein